MTSFAREACLASRAPSERGREGQGQRALRGPRSLPGSVDPLWAPEGVVCISTRPGRVLSPGADAARTHACFRAASSGQWGRWSQTGPAAAQGGRSEGRNREGTRRDAHVSSSLRVPWSFRLSPRHLDHHQGLRRLLPEETQVPATQGCVCGRTVWGQTWLGPPPQADAPGGPQGLPSPQLTVRAEERLPPRR